MRKARSQEEKLQLGKQLGRIRKSLKISQGEVAKTLGLRSQSVVSDWENGRLDSWGQHANELAEMYGLDADQIRAVATGEADTFTLIEPPVGESHHKRFDKAEEDFEAGTLVDYVAVAIMPTYAGMGGGGTGDGEQETALLSRRLVEDELGVRAADVLLVNVRGNSMEPLFFHGDQLLIDKRDNSPTQPGPFAIRHGDEYVVKNVRWVDKRSRLRVWSQNEAIGGEEFYDPEEVEFIGRPVWFARRL